MSCIVFRESTGIIEDIIKPKLHSSCNQLIPGNLPFIVAFATAREAIWSGRSFASEPIVLSIFQMLTYGAARSCNTMDEADDSDSLI